MIRRLAMMQRFTLRYMNIHQYQMMIHMERLSSGKRINRAADDPAGLAISEKMRAQIRGLQQAQRNVQDGISLIRTAEGGLHEKHAILQRIRELSVQAANDTYADIDRKAIQQEIEQLLEELSDMRKSSHFNNRSLYQGGELKLQIGPNAGDSMSIILPNTELHMLENIDVMTGEGAEEAIKRVDEAIQHISSERARLGAYENRLDHRLNYLTNYEVQLTDAASRIRDADMAKEMMGYIKHQLLQQVSMMMLLHTNRQYEQVLKLLQ